MLGGNGLLRGISAFDSFRELSIGRVFLGGGHVCLDVFGRRAVFEEIGRLENETAARLSGENGFFSRSPHLIHGSFLQHVHLIDAAEYDVAAVDDLLHPGEVGVAQRRMCATHCKSDGLAGEAGRTGNCPHWPGGRFLT